MVFFPNIAARFARFWLFSRNNNNNKQAERSSFCGQLFEFAYKQNEKETETKRKKKADW